VAEPELPPTPPQDWPVRPISFPVGGPVTYYDDWGACRGGPDCPRRHIGNDLIGQRLQPLLAARDGVVTHLVLDHPTAGWGLVITDAEGWEYRYYHVNDDTPGTDDGTNPVAWRFAPGVAEGTAVKAGQVVAYLGDSGNAELSVPHLHFEIHLPDGSPIDPYRSLRFSEYMARCSSVAPGLQQESGMMPPVNPGLADAAVHTTSGQGTFLLSLDGSVLALGDARTVGWSRHAAEDPPCPAPAPPAPAG
jgi:murein DD-endopeptidase MepM/ murein hydrolase activator NlpD